MLTRCRQLPQFFPHLQYYELPHVSYTILTSVRRHLSRAPSPMPPSSHTIPPQQYPELLLFRHSAGLKRRIREAASDTNEQ